MEGIGVVDLAILTLLCGGIGYGYVLSRRFEKLRLALQEFGPALEAFSKAVDRSERSVADLRVERVKLETKPPAQPVANLPTPAPTREAPRDEKEELIGSFIQLVRGRRR